jgi:hypothetical protein
MLFTRRAGGLLLAAVFTMLSAASRADPEISAYRWDAPAGPANIDGFSQWLGTPVTVASAFHGESKWSEIEGQDSH